MIILRSTLSYYYYLTGRVLWGVNTTKQSSFHVIVVFGEIILECYSWQDGLWSGPTYRAKIMFPGRGASVDITTCTGQASVFLATSTPA